MQPGITALVYHRGTMNTDELARIEPLLKLAQSCAIARGLRTYVQVRLTSAALRPCEPNGIKTPNFWSGLDREIAPIDGALTTLSELDPARLKYRAMLSG